ncbi:DNA-binding transcription factor yap1 [Didymosphaeria variabile]|uniref:DNA-binding transcription factor yap1 n=1 Tax=Didymosphaeria variabile TaxID=1932322 RepID=A0A9W8XVD0_9PLEO|nr:DNA-binding transcription factor yap1 [Didymosphaeria variabile]KAJ4359485.1 DNA-binding transcription factor yap1 [Didymosphaeria variabile]
MAGTSRNDFQNAGQFYLDPNQQDLLLAALASNNQNHNDIFAAGLDAKQTMNGLPNGQQFNFPVDNIDQGFFTSPQQSTPASAFNNIGGVEESPFGDYLDGDNFDFDNADNGDLMIGELPGDSPDKDGESSEKRKSPGDDPEDPEGGGKRREGDDKQAKKPGRKPLTSEPTTKRKAQNRAAQRAFRERKEKHLKDLETKVAELEKASDSANHENGLLRAQVQRLQMELREYRKRLSLNSSSGSNNRSPSMMGGFSSILNNGGSTNSSFQFEFPRFGGLPGAHILDNGPLSKNKTSTGSSAGVARQDSGRSISSKGPNGDATTPDKTVASPVTSGNSRSGSVNGMFGLNNNSNATDLSNPSSRVFQFNSNSSTHSDSPSASSTSPTNQNSSCDTSPEPSHQSPKNLDTIADGYVCHGNSEGATKSPATAPDPVGFDFFANQNGGNFDPTLFGDYRESQNAIVGDGDFSNGFFNDAFPIADYGSPFHFGDTPAVQKPNPLEEIERIQDGDDEVVPGDDPAQLLNCHKIWDKLSSRSDFKDGTIDIDNLCSELRAKARCSESGVVVDHKDVEAALKRLPKEQRA